MSNLPDATIYWGGSKENERANIREDRLFAKYGPEIPLNAQFSVISWKMNVDSNVITSKGNSLKTAESILKKFDENLISLSKLNTLVQMALLERKQLLGMLNHGMTQRSQTWFSLEDNICSFL